MPMVKQPSYGLQKTRVPKYAIGGTDVYGDQLRTAYVRKPHIFYLFFYTASGDSRKRWPRPSRTPQTRPKKEKQVVYWGTVAFVRLGSAHFRNPSTGSTGG